jgi:hypothetical protein
MGGVCTMASCMDKVKNGVESDVDCGGTGMMACPKCGNGKACGAAGDCTSGVCAMNLCAAPTCMDQVKNGVETDADCGGMGCPACANGKACAVNADCASKVCLKNVCGVLNIVARGAGRSWADGTFAVGCHQYINPPDKSHVYSGATGDGRYTIDPDGAGAIAPFDVFCDMSTDGGGWTLVDNDASAAAAFTTRQAGANPDATVTRGSYLPGYTWSSAPQLLCKSNVLTGNLSWVTLNAIGPLAKEYPTKTTVMNATYSGQWTIASLNGNTDQGTTAWIYTGSGRFSSVWIGNGGQPTCACDYYEPSPQTGLGRYSSGVAATCSTWVR